MRLVLATVWQRKLASSRLSSLRSSRSLVGYDFSLLCFLRFESLPGIWCLGFGISDVAAGLCDVSCDCSRRRFATQSKAPRESYPNVDVVYDSVTMPDGKRLRSIITKPRAAKKKLPVIFLTGWLSCDSVEAPADTKDATGLILRGLAQTPGFCLFKIDKPGCGDSDGDCSQTDFDTELAGYRAAFRALKSHDFIDSDRVYIFGSSNGGGFAPLVPETESEQAQVRGYITIGGWVKTWFEHMLDIERRRFALMKKSPGEVTDRIKGATTLYYEWLIKGRAVAEILSEPELAQLWPDGKDQTHLYGRPLKFYQDLQKLNLAAAWSRVKVPALILHGQC